MLSFGKISDLRMSRVKKVIAVPEGSRACKATIFILV